MTASLGIRKTFLRRPRNPFACRSTFLCAARAITPRFTRGMTRLPLVRQHRLQGALIGIVNHRRTAQMALTLLSFLGQDVAQICTAALESAVGELLETLRRAAFGFQLGHDIS